MLECVCGISDRVHAPRIKLEFRRGAITHSVIYMRWLMKVGR